MAKLKEPKVTVVTTEPIRHDGEDVPVGSPLEVTARQAESLFESGAAVLGPPDQAPPAA